MGDPTTERNNAPPTESNPHTEKLLRYKDRTTKFYQSYYGFLKSMKEQFPNSVVDDSQKNKLIDTVNDFYHYQHLLVFLDQSAQNNQKDKTDQIKQIERIDQSIYQEAIHNFSPHLVIQDVFNLTDEQLQTIKANADQRFAGFREKGKDFNMIPSTSHNQSQLTIADEVQFIDAWDHDLSKYINSSFSLFALSRNDETGEIDRSLFEQAMQRIDDLSDTFETFNIAHEMQLTDIRNIFDARLIQQTDPKKVLLVTSPEDQIVISPSKSIDISDQHLSSLSSKGLIFRIVSNCVQNAKRASLAYQKGTPEAGYTPRIHMDMRVVEEVKDPSQTAEQYLQVSFRDNGTGFSAHRLQAGKFEYGESEYQNDVKGTGTGMPSVQRDVLAAGGTIHLENVSSSTPDLPGLPHHGAIITFRFPILHLQKPEFEPQAVPTE